MTLRLVDSGWSKELTDGLGADNSELRIVCPFIKVGALERLLRLRPRVVRVITRFNLADFAQGVSDIGALRRVLEIGGKVRGVKNLHAKIYVFGSSRAIVTSANLTAAALDRNPEFGIVTRDATNIASCVSYFDDLWRRARDDLIGSELDAWQRTVSRDRASGGRPRRRRGLRDYGRDIGFPVPPSLEIPVADAEQAFVKFLGEGHNRAELTREIMTEIQRSGCHWAVAYPAARRPTGVKDGAVVFIARLTKDPGDIRVFGRAIAIKHVPKRDDATRPEIAMRPWKAQWPRYIRVHDAKFIAGTMANGVSLNQLMARFGANAFASTQRNVGRGRGNVDPRKAYRQQAAVELTAQSRAWLGEQLEAAFREHGTVPQDALDALDWPRPVFRVSS